jgi:alkanesulfonate monooxygenase SsuD/methylene tetrahydromethanopterin reductase-like flavin-dependent oxidoreductase (luciferase family)
MTLALLVGKLDQAKAIGELYWRTAEEFGQPREQLGIGTVGHLHVGPTPELARDVFYPHYRAYVAEGRGIDITRARFDAMSGPDGALMVGGPQEIADKILRQHEVLHLDRFLGQIDLGGLARHHVLQSIELLGTEVAALVHGRLPAGASR